MGDEVVNETAQSGQEAGMFPGAAEAATMLVVVTDTKGWRPAAPATARA
ncbi:MAG: hypothetical protein KIS67_21800 [Verrucomicrobiae bacterium]|nr:hypothetical protein [Verrucomicrobiae bacterium]